MTYQGIIQVRHSIFPGKIDTTVSVVSPEDTFDLIGSLITLNFRPYTRTEHKAQLQPKSITGRLIEAL